MYTDLIVGYDGTPDADDALVLARRLALATGARPTVLYVRPYPWPVLDDAADDVWADTVEFVLDRARKRMVGVAGAMFHAVGDTSSPARALHRAAQEAEAALIVLGARHHAGPAGGVPGATAQAVIHLAPCAVAIATAGDADPPATRPFGLVTAAVDGGDETERVARVAGRIARAAGARLRLVTVVDEPFGEGPLLVGATSYGTIRALVRDSGNEVLARAAEAAGPGIDIERDVAEGSVAGEITRTTADADLLVIGSRGYGPLRRVVLGSQTGKVLSATACPVLVVPRRTAEEADDAVVPLAAATLAADGATRDAEHAGG